MEDLKKLQEMAKNGDFSKKLLKDEDFKSKLKKILKEEKGIDITDEQIPEIIKNFEAALQDDKLLEEAELENVSGGGNKWSRKKMIIVRVAGHLGAIIPGVATEMVIRNKRMKHVAIPKWKEYTALGASVATGEAVGATIGYLICDKLGIK